MSLDSKLKYYYFTAIFSVLFSVLGFSYNAWRLEVSEDNATTRTASFQILLQLSQLESNIYSLHYDKNEVEGSPRRGWIAVGLVNDLAMLVSEETQQKAGSLHQTWSAQWELLRDDPQAVALVIRRVDEVREAVKAQVLWLQ